MKKPKFWTLEESRWLGITASTKIQDLQAYIAHLEATPPKSDTGKVREALEWIVKNSDENSVIAEALQALSLLPAPQEAQTVDASADGLAECASCGFPTSAEFKYCLTCEPFPAAPRRKD